ncbi:MAG: metal-dependent hydrolase [Nitrososphaerota archaeon]
MEPLIHFIILFTALILANIKFKKALLISLLSLLPDLDALFLIHRSFSHSIIVLLIGTIVLLWIAHKKKKFQDYVLLGFIGILSHLILDLFSGYTPILWPLYNYSLWIKVDFIAHIDSSLSFTYDMKIVENPIDFYKISRLDAPLFTSEGLIIFIILFIAILIKIFRKY